MSADGPSYADPDVYTRLAAFEGQWRDTWWNGDYLDLLATRFGLNDRTQALDVGCGAGHWGRALLPRMAAHAHLTGVDHEQAFVELAQEGAAGVPFSAVRGDAQALPFDDDTFDLVTCQTVLIHVRDAQQAVREMCRVCKPGGVVLLVEPDNLTMANSFVSTSVPLSIEERLAILRLQMISEAGKRALGEGDGSVGARLPALLHHAGASGIRAFASDKCARAIPPYEQSAEAIDLREQLRFAGMDMWLQTGPRDDTWRHFEAGGGTRDDFDMCWDIVTCWLRAFEAQVEAGEFSTARPICMVVCGAQPSAPT